ncbi:MAG: RNA polymerase sigma factor [Saprospiraceae bacterium]|nr:RNA polymerase sigma factor [Saprospiraceae bacterium]
MTGLLKDQIRDEEAIDLYLKSQNIHYFNLIYERYSDKVYAKCVTMLKNQDNAEDATQDIFMRVLLNLSKFSGNSKFSTWLYSITYNHCIDELRKVQKEIIVKSDNLINNYNVEDNIDDAQIKEKNVYRLKEVLHDMMSDDKGILIMKYQEDMSIKDLCLILNKSESAVKMKILRAKERFIKIYDTKYSD